MKKVAYCTSKGEYSDRRILAVFLAKEKAEKALGAYIEYDEDGQPYEWGGPSIVEIPLEPEFPACPSGHSAYTVEFTEKGLAYTDRHDCLEDWSYPEGEIVVRRNFKGISYEVFIVDVIARDRDHAVKAASEKWAAFKARKAGIA